MRDHRRRTRAAAGGLLAAAVAAGVGFPRAATACDGDMYLSPCYADDVSVGVFLGLSFAPAVRFVYGVDVRLGRGPVVGLGRVEFHGRSLLKVTGGVQLFAKSSAVEFGLAHHTSFGSQPLGSSIGLHLAGGAWDPNAALMFSSTLPFHGDLDNYAAALTLTLGPEAPNIAPSGRPLRAGDQRLLPLLVTSPRARGADAEALARYWGRAAQLEHSSVRSFQRAAAELRALGAPAALRARARTAATDEARHTRLCLGALGHAALAPLAATAARPRWAGPTPGALATLAREAWQDGCVGETLAVAEARDAARASRDRQARQVQTDIAHDEAAHAELSWDILAWSWSCAVDDERDRMRALVDAEPAPGPDAPAAAVDHDRLAAMGVPHPARDAARRARVLEAARRRARELLS